VVTTAVSGALVHLPFFETLQAYCEQIEAQLLVVPSRYHNPTAARDDAGWWFDERLEPYMAGVPYNSIEHGRSWHGQRAELTPDTLLLADITIQPTAARPLSGLLQLSGAQHGIFGHTKVTFESVPTRPGQLAKFAVTTGAITRPEYSISKAGAKGEFHHVLGALLVEPSKGGTHFRHLLANASGDFCDLNQRFSRKSKPAEQRAKVLACGDLHLDRADKRVLDQTFFNDDSIVATLKPEAVVLHDVLDFHSGSHHNTLFKRYEKFLNGTESVEKEVERSAFLLSEIVEAAPEDTKFYVVSSNHSPDHFVRWLEGLDRARDLPNKWFYHATSEAYCRAIIKGNKDFDPFAYWFQRWLATNVTARVTFLTRNGSFFVQGVEYGQHGDRGPNGVKGAPNAFVRVGVKMIIGHGHSPGIYDGVYQVGTSSQMDMGYNAGFSSWAHTHAVQYQTGKRSLLHVLPEGWRGVVP